MGGRAPLREILDQSHSLYCLSDRVNWAYLEKSIGVSYHESPGRPTLPVRLLVGLHYLKYLENKSDEEVVSGFVENPYWQYFCGCETFEHRVPLHPSSLGKWRKRIGLKRLEKLLEETLNIARRGQFLDSQEVKRVNVDTTVQEKAITFPTDAKLLHKMRRILVKEARKRCVFLRQSYERLGQKAFLMQSRYAHARQMRKSRAQLRRLKSYLGRVIRDIERKLPKPDKKMRKLLSLAKRIFTQKKEDKNKVYSIHAPEVECISKGKAHKKYEFGCKVSLVTTSRQNWIVGVEACHGNPYDGHTLKSSLDQVQRLYGQRPEQAFVDRGYRGKHNHPDDVQVFVAGTKARHSLTLKRFLKRRAAIEPVIGHTKSDHRMNRNHLAGKFGDAFNAVLSGCAFNLRKILNLITQQNQLPKLVPS